MLMKYLTLLYTHLKWVFDFLLYYPFYTLHGSQFPIIGEEQEQGMCQFYEPNLIGSEEEEIDCAVCLSKIEGGEEIRVLRCDHFFHRDCLDTWFGFKNPTCPLCRGSMGPRRAINEVGAQVLLFEFCATRTHDDRDTWWLR
ncbi:putative RING-H2 finger protein ATL50 [Lotus japonicus]|uniref:RING-type domain-containing protein n=1 Tax=Lotus japonicus TaxID=34305 RepID=I3SP32_LOTJA|nr:putative RING-H2 finger protein ATL50 [Lotus japonicus]AFK42024.1 unknown [Lotus japonicus]